MIKKIIFILFSVVFLNSLHADLLLSKDKQIKEFTLYRIQEYVDDVFYKIVNYLGNKNFKTKHECLSKLSKQFPSSAFNDLFAFHHYSFTSLEDLLLIANELNELKRLSINELEDCLNSLDLDLKNKTLLNLIKCYRQEENLEKMLELLYLMDDDEVELREYQPQWIHMYPATYCSTSYKNRALLELIKLYGTLNNLSEVQKTFSLMTDYAFMFRAFGELMRFYAYEKTPDEICTIFKNTFFKTQNKKESKIRWVENYMIQFDNQRPYHPCEYFYVLSKDYPEIFYYYIISTMKNNSTQKLVNYINLYPPKRLDIYEDPNDLNDYIEAIRLINNNEYVKASELYDKKPKKSYGKHFNAVIQTKAIEECYNHINCWDDFPHSGNFNYNPLCDFESLFIEAIQFTNAPNIHDRVLLIIAGIDLYCRIGQPSKALFFLRTPHTGAISDACYFFPRYRIDYDDIKAMLFYMSLETCPKKF